MYFIRFKLQLGTSNSCMVYMLVNIPVDKIDHNKELNLIINIAVFNTYKKKLIFKTSQITPMSKKYKLN